MRRGIAHAIGYHELHPGNHEWMRSKTNLGSRHEREAVDFAEALLIDQVEAFDQGLGGAWEIAEYFGVPEEMVRVQPELL